jgi:hypothetical protein
VQLLEKLNPWSPITDSTDLKILGKQVEELNEAGSATARCIVQGIDEAEPTTGKINRRWLEEEMADVYACFAHTVERFDLDTKFIAKRAQEKYDRLATWHAMPVTERKEVNAHDPQEA